MKSKYTLLSRSQIMMRIHALEQILLHVKGGSERDRVTRKERAELFVALKEKDDALIRRFNGDNANARR